MKATIAGTPSASAALRAAAGDGEVRTIGGWTWVDLGFDVRKAVIDALAGKTGSLDVIEVEMQSGGRGSGLHATRRTLPAGREIDLSEEARETLRDWVDQGSGGGFDEEDAAIELAWTFAAEDGEDTGDDEEQWKAPAGKPRLDTWAGRLLAHLVSTRSIALDPEPEDALEADLATALEEEDEEARLAEVSEMLLSHPDVDDVFIDDTELAEAIVRTRQPS